MVVITFSVVKITFLGTEIAFEVTVITSLVAKITFVMDEITFQMVMVKIIL